MMHSFLPTEQTAPLVFFNICLLFLMYVLMERALRPPYCVKVSNKNFVVILMFVFVVFSFWGADWFHYLTEFKVLKLGGRTNLEKVYIWIAQNLSPNYLDFRVVVWGSSLCLLLHIFKRLTIPTHLAIFFFSTIYIIWFSYARVTLAMMLVYYGLTILYKPYKNRLLSFVLAFFSIGSAFFFHKSALFGIVVALLTIFVNRFEKKIFIILLLCYPILVYLAQSYLIDFLMVDMEGEDGGFGANMAAGQRYLEGSIKGHGTGYLIQSFLEKFPHFLLAFVSLIFMRSKYYLEASSDIKAFIRLQFFVVLLSSLFMFDLGANTDVIYTRFLRFAVIPSCIILTYFYSTHFKFKYTRIAYYLAFMGTIYAVVYSMYNAYVG